jgi:cytidine deaminase
MPELTKKLYGRLYGFNRLSEFSMKSTKTLDELFAAAATARKNAYARYSGFAVGAAIRVASGAIFSAANVENAAYPVGTCAEAGAIAAMVAAGEREIAEILILAESPDPVMPCGACRQRISEFAVPETTVYSAEPAGVRETVAFAELFPRAFGPSSLGLE